MHRKKFVRVALTTISAMLKILPNSVAQFLLHIGRTKMVLQSQA